MDGNKDEAKKCLKIAEDSIQSGNRERALKFLNKARRLDPSLEIDHLLSQTDATSQSENPSSNIPTHDFSSENGARRRVSGSGGSSVAYSEEQVTIVKEIKRKKDYYEILGLEKSSCSVEDVRKAYRKLSLKVHPDKNKAPGAEDAFKMVSKAFQCLSDEESRRRYDLVGSEEEAVYERRPHRHAGGARMNTFNGFYDDGNVDAEEIFRNFFFGGMRPATTTTHFSFGPRVDVRYQGPTGWLRTLIQLLPVILILLLNFLPSSDPVYSFSKSYPYDHRLTTQRGVNYYVKTGKFEQEYPINSPKHAALEEKVENDYYSILSHNCRLEMQQFHWGYRRETPNCDSLKQFQTAA
uniref:Chaperone protein dnaJ 49 n=1 Tax=Nicotiana tabacum TaxID=4097 RepID=A0A1S4A5D7_TOBAC|nr:PREDICTED: chaperone protein dnaJ 49-like [Nicotiana tabacum]